MTTNSPETRPCPDCGADCNVQVFGPNKAIDPAMRVWICANHRLLGGDCVNETASLSRVAWNARTPADPETSGYAEEIPETPALEGDGDGLVERTISALVETLDLSSATMDEMYESGNLREVAQAMIRTLQARVEPTDEDVGRLTSIVADLFWPSKLEIADCDQIVRAILTAIKDRT